MFHVACNTTHTHKIGEERIQQNQGTDKKIGQNLGELIYHDSELYDGSFHFLCWPATRSLIEFMRHSHFHLRQFLLSK